MRRGLYGGLRRTLERPGADRAVCILALALIAFSIDTGLSADDHLHQLIARGSTELKGFVRAPLDLFGFASPGHTATLIREGVLSWWDDPEAKLAFMRPLSAVTHYIDYRFWPDAPWLMHVHSLLWAAFLFFSLLVLYRDFISPAWVCALTMFIYALDDARGWFGSWIASRNSIVATAFSIWVLIFYHRFRTRDFKAGLWLSPLFLGLGLLGGEGAIAICGYLFAYAVFIDQGAWRPRLAGLLPHVAVLVVWREVYRTLGYGVMGSGLYFDPSTDLQGFLGAFVERAPVLLFAQVGGSWSDIWSAMFAFPNLQHLLVAVSVFGLSVLGYAVWPLVRSDRLVRFGLCGGLLSLFPASATFSADRLLTWVAIGLSIVLARLIATYFDQPQALMNSALRALVLPPLMLGLVFEKAVIEPLFLPSRARGNLILRNNLDRAEAAVSKAPAISRKRIVYINPAAVPFVAYIPIERAALHVPRPKAQTWLATSETQVRVERVDARTLRVRPRGGFILIPTSRLLRDVKRRFTLGAVVALDGLSIEITELTSDGRPAEILARFDRVLEDPVFVWLEWQGSGLVPFTPPPIGRHVTLPAADYFRVVLGDAVHLPFDGRLPPPPDPAFEPGDG